MSKIKQIKLPDNNVYDIDLPDTDPTKVNTVHNVLSLSTVAGSATDGSVKSVRWYVSGVDGITAPYDGMKIAVRIPLAGVGTGGAMLSLNGDSDDDYHPVAYNVNTVFTTHYPVSSIKYFTYDASQTMTGYKVAGTAVTITGVWKAEADYDTDKNTTTTYGTLLYYFRPYTAARLTPYKVVALDNDNRLVPITTEQYMGTYSTSTTYVIGDIVVKDGAYYRSKANSNKNKAVTNTTYWETYTMPAQFTPTTTAFKPNKLRFYNSSSVIAASGVVGGQTLIEIGYNTNVCTYTFGTTIVAYRIIYLQGTYDKTTGLFTLDTGADYFKLVPDNTANLTLSSYFTSGKDYILLGATYSTNNYFQIFEVNTMYHFDGTNLVSYDTWNAEQKQAALPTTTTAGQVLKSTSTAGTVEWGTVSGGSVGTLQDVTDQGNTTTNNLILSSASGDSPYLEFLRGTEADNYNDWRIIDSGGYLYFRQKGQSDSSFQNVFYITNQGDFMFTGNNAKIQVADANHFIRKNASTSLLELGAGGSTVLQVGSGTSTFSSNLRPTTNGQKNLGAASYAWNDFHMLGKIKTGTNSAVELTLPSTTGTLALKSEIPDGPMIFKGSLGTNGTITTLPTAASSNNGYTYKVITDGTYASQAAKVGDVFISNGTEWVLIPSGDDMGGGATVTSVGIELELGGSGNITLDASLGVASSTQNPIGLLIKFDDLPASSGDYTHAIAAGQGYHIDSGNSQSVAFSDVRIMYIWPDTSGVVANALYPQVQTIDFGTVEINSDYSYSNPYILYIVQNGDVQCHVWSSTGGGGSQ